MSDPKWHHFLPEMYLRNFTDPNCPPNFEPYVWIRDLPGEQWKGKAPQNVAAETGYYRADEYVADPVVIERALGILESAGARILRKIQAEEPLTETDRLRLSFFIATLKLRVPAHRERVKQRFEDKGKKMLADLAKFYKDHPHVMEDDNRAYEQRTGTKLPPIDPAKLPDMVSLSINRVGEVGEPLRYSAELAYEIMRLTWTIYRASADHFITSDDPVLLTVLNDREGNELVGEFSVPLARDLLLIGLPSKNDRDPIHVAAHRPLVGFANRRTQENCRKFLIASKAGFITRTKIPEPYATFKNIMQHP